MEWIIWIILAYFVVAVLTFVGLCRKYVPLDIVAMLSLAFAALIWPVSLVGGL